MKHWSSTIRDANNNFRLTAWLSQEERVHHRLGKRGYEHSHIFLAQLKSCNSLADSVNDTWSGK